MTQDTTLKKIGENIRKIREQKNIKQEYLAAKAGVTKSAISRIENGARDTTLKTILQIAFVLEESVVSFFE